MKTIRLAAASINTTPLDWDGNVSKILACISDAQHEKAAILCLPEMCICGYGCEDMFLAPHVLDQAMSLLTERILPATANLFVCVGLPVAYKGSVFNCVASLYNKRLLGFTAKQHLAGDGIHYEPRWFKPWQQGAIDTIQVNCTKTTRDIPFGDTRFDIGGIRIGYEICEDAWVSGRPGNDLARQGVDIILNPSASHFAFGKIQTRERFVLEGSRAFQCAYVYANLNGNEAGRVIYDGGCLIASCGELLARGPRFHQEQARITTAVLNLPTLKNRQIASASRIVELGHDPLLVKNEFGFDKMGTAEVKKSPSENQTQKPGWETTFPKEEEFTRAITLGLRDYMIKSRTEGFVISLSGGADSAAAAALVFYMAKLNGYDTENLLTTVYQATENSGETTKNAACRIAEALGATHHFVNVGSIVDNYLANFESAIGRKLTWDRDDITLQNIQARARGPMAWLFANTENKLLLSTSNRSEAAVGYATMDGDTCGAISPLAGIDKAFLLQWLKWATNHGPEGIGCIPALEIITAQKPTAELRPETDGKSQTDEDDLMPYPVLDAIEKLAIRDKLDPESIKEAITDAVPQHRNQIPSWINKFQTLWCRNQWKRDRFAPSLHVDDENLDPKTWCRAPLLRGAPPTIK